MDTEIKTTVNDLINKKEKAVILEIGAHYGEDTLEMLSVFSNPVIYCFEPDPRNFAFLQKHMQEKVQLYNVALFNEDGEKDFYQSYKPYPENTALPDKYRWIGGDDYRNLKLNNSGSSSLKSGHEMVKDAEIVKVKTMRLDEWAKQEKVNLVDFIWMDVQGAEKEVIDGGRFVFSNTSYVWTEFGETEYEGGMDRKQTIDLFDNLGFSFKLQKDNNILFENGDKHG